MAREAARRFLFTSLLISWANRRFGLLESGQRALVYHAPVPSVHQEELSSCTLRLVLSRALHEPVPLGMERWRSEVSVHAPVPSGAEPQPAERRRQAARGRHHRQRSDRAAQPLEREPGEQRHSHQHGQPLARPRSCDVAGFVPEDEKRLGDLAIKIYEHFLALFVGTYTAAPYRIGFTEFHPERLLSFLPHELDFTHLRLLWREWKEKAQLSRVRTSTHALRAALARQHDLRNSFACAAIAFPMRAC